MRCCLRSTTWAGSVLVVLALVAGIAVRPAVAMVSDEAVREAVARAVAQRVGTEARVVVRDLVVRLADGEAGSVFATIPGDAKAGAPVRVILKVLRDDGRASRFGEATCAIDVRMRGLRATRPIGRGEELAVADVEAVDVDATGLVLRPLPIDLQGARAVLDIAAGQVLNRSMVVPVPLVRTGDVVQLTLVSGDIVVEGRGIASQNGKLGDVIQVVAPDTKRRIAARVSGRGLAEVQHGR